MVAMASNRTYGLNTDAGETMQPQPFSLVGNGAGSVFKIFTVAAAHGYGHGHQRPAATGRRPGSRPRAWAAAAPRAARRPPGVCSNAGNYRGTMSVTDALATSPNTAFAKLISQVGVQKHRRHGGQAGPAVLRAARHRPRL